MHRTCRHANEIDLSATHESSNASSFPQARTLRGGSPEGALFAALTTRGLGRTTAEIILRRMFSQLLDSGTIRSNKAPNALQQAVARVAGALGLGALVAVPVFLGADVGAGAADGSALQALAAMFNSTRGVFV